MYKLLGHPVVFYPGQKLSFRVVADIPIDVSVNDATPVIAYLFLLAFVFLIGEYDILLINPLLGAVVICQTKTGFEVSCRTGPHGQR